MRPILAGGLLFALSAIFSTPIAGDGSGAGSPHPAGCLVEISGHDAHGNAVFQTPGYRLDRPGLLVTALHVLQRGGVRWAGLRVTGGDSMQRQPVGVGPGRQDAATDVIGLTLVDPARNLVVLHAPEVPTCSRGIGSPPPNGAPVTGLRERHGYRPAVFSAIVERSISLPDGPAIMRVKIPEGGGADSGFLLDRHQRLVANLMPTPAGADPLLVAAAALTPELIADADRLPGIPLATLSGPSPEVRSDSKTPLLARAMVLARGRQAASVVAILDELAGETGEFPGLLIERGAVQFELGRIDRAIADFSAACRAAPDDHLAHYNLGISLGTLGDYAGAAAVFKNAVSLAPDHPATRYHLAMALKASHRPREAREQYSHLARLDPAMAADLASLLGP